MISSEAEHEKAQEELRSLEQRLDRLQGGESVQSKRLTEAGIRKLIARLREELANFEAREPRS